MTSMRFGRVFSVCFFFWSCRASGRISCSIKWAMNKWTFIGKIDCLQRWIEWLNGRQLFQMNFDILNRVINDHGLFTLITLTNEPPHRFQFLIESNCPFENCEMADDYGIVQHCNMHTFRIEFWISLNIHNEILYVLSVTVARIRYISIIQFIFHLNLMSQSNKRCIFLDFAFDSFIIYWLCIQYSAKWIGNMIDCPGHVSWNSMNKVFVHAKYCTNSMKNVHNSLDFDGMSYELPTISR